MLKKLAAERGLSRSKLFRRTLLSTVIIMLAFVVLFGLVTSRMMNNLIEEIQIDNMTSKQKLLSQTADMLSAQTDALFSDVLTNDQLVNYLYSSRSDKILDYNAFRALNRYMVLYPFVTNISVINEDAGGYISVMRQDDTVAFFDAHKTDSRWIARKLKPYPTYATRDANRLNVITVVYSVAASKGERTKGIVVDISQDYFQSLLTGETSKVSMVIDGSGTVITHTDKSMFLSDLSGDPAVAPIIASELNSGTNIIHNADEDEFVAHARLDGPDWICVSIYSYADIIAPLYKFLRIAFLVLGALFVFGVISLFISVRKNYAPIHALTRTIEPAQGDGVLDEVRLLSGTFSSLKYQNQALRSYVEDSYLHSLLSGANTGASKEEYVDLNRAYAAAFYRVVLIRLKDGGDILDTARRTAEKIKTELDGQRNTRIALCGEDLIMLWLVNSQAESNAVVQDCQALFEGVPCWIICSDEVNSLSGIHGAFQQTCALLPFRFYAEDGSIICSALEKRHSAIEMNNSALLSQTAEQIRRVNKPVALELLTQLLDELAALTPDSCRHCARKFLNTVRGCITQSSDRIDHMLLACGSEVTAAETFEALSAELRSFAGNCIDELVALRELSAKSRNSELVSGIKDFIAENYARSDLSVDVIATDAGLSSGYIGKIFKAETGSSVNEYLSEYRIRQATEMLVGSDSTVAEVAQRAGFNSVSYFITQFKHFMNTTPKQYQALKRSGQGGE